MKEHKFRVPRTLGRCADLLYKLREQRYALQREVEALKKKESEIREHVINTLPKSQASGISGKTALAKVIVKEEPKVKDQEQFLRYLQRSKRWDLACKLRPSARAIHDMWEDGKEIPGVEKFNNVTVSLTKV